MLENNLNHFYNFIQNENYYFCYELFCSLDKQERKIIFNDFLQHLKIEEKTKKGFKIRFENKQHNTYFSLEFIFFIQHFELIHSLQEEDILYLFNKYFFTLHHFDNGKIDNILLYWSNLINIDKFTIEQQKYIERINFESILSYF